MELTHIEPWLKKKPWARLVNIDSDAPLFPIADAIHYDIPTSVTPGLRYQYLSSIDLLNESTEGARQVNSPMFSQRPVSEIVTRQIETVGPNGEPILKDIKEEVVIGYDTVETVRSGLPEMIITQHVSHLGKNGIEIADESGKDREAYDNVRSWKDISGLDSTFLEALYHAGKAGDVAVYSQICESNIERTVFSTVKGDTLFPHRDDQGRPFLVRLYQLNGRDTADFYFTDSIQTWVRGDIDQENPNSENGVQSWFAAIKGWFKNISVKKSADGWTRISKSPTQLDNATCQVSYLRFDDSFVGLAMQNINAFDRTLSYTSDKMRSTAYSKFMVKAAKLKSLPQLSSGEEVIAFDGDVEALKASDAKYLTPPDISNIATINNKNIYDAIMQSCMSIDLQPEILKSGADSSQTLKLLLRREMQWCHVMWPKVRPFAAHLINVHKALVGKLEGDISRYSKLKISVWNTPWLPQDESAQIENATKLVYAGVLSRENARQELGIQYSDDPKIVSQEADADLYRKTFVPLQAQADAQKKFGNVATETIDVEEDNPAQTDAKPGVDNRAAMRPTD